MGANLSELRAAVQHYLKCSNGKSGTEITLSFIIII